MDKVADDIVFPHLIPGNTNVSTGEGDDKVLLLNSLDYALSKLWARDNGDLFALMKLPLAWDRKIDR